MALVIPGVQVTVVKDVVPQQLAPTGVLGLAGITENDLNEVVRASSWNEVMARCGPGTAYSIPEARQALDNGVYQLVISPVRGGDQASFSLSSPGGPSFTLKARARGAWARTPGGSGLGVKVTSRKNSAGQIQSFDMEIERPGDNGWERHRQLSAVPGAVRYMPAVLASESSLVVASSNVRFKATAADQTLTGDARMVLLDDGHDAVDANHLVLAIKARDGGPTLKVSARSNEGLASVTVLKSDQAAQDFSPVVTVRDLVIPRDESRLVKALQAVLEQQDPLKPDYKLEIGSAGWPLDGEDYTFPMPTEAWDADADAYVAALDRLQTEPDVDMVLAAIQDFSKDDKVTKIYNAVISHCQVMSNDCKGRIGFGQVAPGATARKQVELAKNVLSDRFVLVSPSGVVGAVAGMVGSLPYHYSPTFKRVSGLGVLKTVTLDDLSALVGGWLVVVAGEPGRGQVVLRGLTTDGDQINVRRVADHAVRGVKARGQLFIGSLNTEDGRSALKQTLTEFLLQMQKEGALVPKVDNSDPAFKVNVYSSPDDFKLGIVRIDIAVRPVRAIDYIYATIQIQA